MTGIWRTRLRPALIALITTAVLAGGIIIVDPAPASAGSCSVAGQPGTTSTWHSTGYDSYASVVASEFGLYLYPIDASLRWEIPICRSLTGQVALNGSITVVAAPATPQDEAAALNQATNLVMADVFRPEPLLSPDRSLPQYAGLETWLAVDQAGWVPVGPKIGVSGSVTVTATGRPIATVWTFADGTVITCDGPGELYTPGGPTDAPCGKDWDHTSSVMAHAVQVAVRYEVTWSSSMGNSGSFTRTGGSRGAYALQVNEIQTVGVWGDRPRLEDPGVPQLVAVEANCSATAYATGICDPADLTEGDNPDGECGALTGPIEAAIGTAGDNMDAVIAGLSQWADDSGLADAGGGILGAVGWLGSQVADVFSWGWDHTGAYVVDAGSWAFDQGSEWLAGHADELRWVQGKAGELWGMVDDEVIAVAGGFVDAGGAVLTTTVSAVDSVVDFADASLDALMSRADALQAAIEASGIGDALGVGIDVVTGVANGVADVAIAIGGCLVWIGQETYDALPDVLKNLPILGGMSAENLIGCAKALGGNITDIWDTAESLFNAVSDPSGSYNDFKSTVTDLVGAIKDDPLGVAADMGLDIVNDVTYQDLRENHGYGQWVGAIACELAVTILTTIFTGGTLPAAVKAGRIGRLLDNAIDTIDALLPDIRLLRRRLDPDGDGRLDLDPDSDVVRDIFSCPRNSFPAGTLVLLANGALRPIELISAGEAVATAYPTTGQPTVIEGLVIDAWSGDHDRPLVSVTTDNNNTANNTAAAGVGDLGGFTSTDGHRIWQADEAGWIEAADLSPGDVLSTPAGTTTIVEIHHGVAGDGVVWDMMVTPAHTFYVTNQPNAPPVLVHNCDIQLKTDRFGDQYLEYIDPDGTVWKLTEKNRLFSTDPDGNITILDEFDRTWRIDKNSPDRGLMSNDSGDPIVEIIYGADGRELDRIELRSRDQLAERVNQIFDSENPGDDIVLGRIRDTKGSDLIDGQFRLDAEDWTPELNDAIIDRLIGDADPVRLVTDPSDYLRLIDDPSLPDPDDLLGSVFTRELQQLIDAGWRPELEASGDWYFVPPDF